MLATAVAEPIEDKFASLKLKLDCGMTKIDVGRLAVLFGVERGIQDYDIKRPLDLLDYLEKRDMFGIQKVNKLIEGLREVQLESLSKVVEDYKKECL